MAADVIKVEESVSALQWHNPAIGTAPANVIVQRPANASSSDRLTGALTALDRIVKTIFVLRYLSDLELRHRVQLQLNRGEARHESVACCCGLMSQRTLQANSKTAYRFLGTRLRVSSPLWSNPYSET
ncbi:MAG: transposase [Acidobacteriota bacterium]|nr:transposase [Acidobacteriota bacterium]